MKRLAKILIAGNDCVPGSVRLTFGRSRYVWLTGFGRMVAFAVAVTCVLLTGASAASTNGPPTFDKIITEVYATRASIGAQSFIIHGYEAHWRIEYSASGGGPWTLAATGFETPAKNDAQIESYPRTVLRHLKPETPYYVRIVAENSAGTFAETASFTTSPVSKPEIISGKEPDRRSVEPIELVEKENVGYEVGPTFMTVTADVESNGAATTYAVEYAESGSGPWAVAASGSIGVAEDYAQPQAALSGLSPGKGYLIRVKATNEKGTGEVSTVRYTPNGVPEVTTASQEVRNDTETSAEVLGAVVPYSTETHWRLESADSPSGPWSPIPGGSGTLPGGEPYEQTHRVTGDMTGLLPDTTYYVRVFAENKYGSMTSTAGSFETFGAPETSTFATHSLHAETVRALGSVVPHGFDTHAHFEYVTQGHFEQEGFANALTTPAVDMGSGGSNGPTTSVVGQDLAGLQSGVTYRYRLVASSAASGNPTVDGPEQSFTVPSGVEAGANGGVAPPACGNEALRSGVSAQLPDCRAYEMVTPQDKRGAQDVYSYSSNSTPTVVGEDGERVIVQTLSKWGESSASQLTDYLFARAPGGWSMTSDVSQPQAGEESYRINVLNPDLTQAGFLTYTETKFGSTGHGPSQTFRSGPFGGPYATAATAPYQETNEKTNDAWAGMSDDGSKLVLRTTDHELQGHPTGTVSGDDLYEYANGKLSQLNVQSDESPIGSCGAALPYGREDYGGIEIDYRVQQSSHHVLSRDGSKVFFAAVPGSNCSAQAHLYMRVDGKETVDIGEYGFLGAGPDGSKLLLVSVNSDALVVYDTNSRNYETQPVQYAGEAQIVSEDLTAYYFWSDQKLTPEAPNPTGGSDVYRYDIATKTLHFVAEITEASQQVESSGGYSVSPDGRYYYFPAHEVAGLPIDRSESGAATEQVYRYDSQENTIQCMSCASSFDREPKLSAVFVPNDAQSDLTKILVNGGAQRIASDNGDYVFFDTPAALVPQDIDGELFPEGTGRRSDFEFSESSDVYEWRKLGVDGCARLEGCLALISSGTGGEKNELLGTTPSGRDVFFATHSQLVTQDQDQLGDLYDARIGGGIPAPAPPAVECEGDACSSPPSAPNDFTPSSFTFAGPSNVQPVLPVAKGPAVRKKARCAKGRRHVRGRCVKTKRRRAVRGRKSAAARGRHGRGR